MHPSPFEYYSPKSIPEAISLLNKYPGDSKVLAGGHSLIPIMKLRLASPRHLIDIGRIPDLEYITKRDEWIEIGALTRYREIERSELLKSEIPVLPEAASWIGDPQVRNMGTIGGNIVHGDPGNDLPPTMLCLDARFVLTGESGARVITADKFFVDTFTTELKHNEILTKVQIRLPSIKSGSAFEKFERKVGDFAIVSVAAQLCLDENDSCTNVGIGLGSVGPTALKARAAEDLLHGKKISNDLIKSAAQLCSDACSPSSDVRGPSDYKKAMVKVFAERALLKALSRARNQRIGGKK